MRGEEVSAELPFISSRASSRHAARGRRGRDLSAPGKGRLLGTPDGAAELSEAAVPRGVDGAEMGWRGPGSAPQDGRLGLAFIPLPGSAGCRDTSTPHDGHDVLVAQPHWG